MSQVILFDLDGTLTESGEGITKCVQYALEKLGIVEEDLKKLESFIGPPLKDSFMKYGGFTEEQAEQGVAFYRERYVTDGIFENRLYPKVSELLELLQINDKIMAVASSKPEIYVRQILEHFGIASYFKEIVGSELNGERVAKADVIEEALSRLQMQTERDKVVMVGDRAEDVQGAIKCGIQCVGVLYGYGSEEELKQAGAVYLAEDVEDLAVLASPNDEETTEHVESIRQNDLKEPEVSEEVSEATEETTELSGEETEVTTEEVEKEVVEEQQEVQETAETTSNSDDTVEVKEEPENPWKKRLMEDDDDDFLEPAYPKVKKSKEVKMHPLHHLWRWVYPLGLYLVLSIVVTMCTGIYLAVKLLLGTESYDVEMLMDMILDSSLLQTMITGILSILICWLFYRSDQKKRAAGTLGKGKDPKWCPLIAWISMIVLSIAGCQLMNDLITVSGLHEMFPTYSNVATETIYNQSPWLILVTVVLVAPVAEELIFRGLLFRRMKDWVKPWLAVLLSALAFGLYHGNMVQFIYATVMGAIFATIYHKTGTLWTTIVAHLVANFWSILGYGYVTEFAQTIPYGTWIVIAGSALLCIIPAYWIVIYKHK